MQLQFHKVVTLPAVLESDAFYFVEDIPNARAEAYLTDDAGVARAIGNTAMIQSIINSSLASVNLVEIAADIAARDTLTGAATGNLLILVVDASADPTVTSGAAFYGWDDANSTVYKISEFESLDVVLDWNNIVNGPTSTAAAIDQAVTDSHTHANKAELDRLGINASNQLTIDSNVATGVIDWNTLNW